MLAELKINFTVMDDGELNVYQSSNFHGLLMENITQEYADKIHISTLHPYSQYISVDGKEVTWYIKTLNEEAYENIILPMLSSTLNQYEIKKKNVRLQVKSKNLITKTKKELLNDFYEGEYNRYIDISFLSPTSFKRDGRYLNMPDLELIYRSLMKKYSSSSDDTDMFDNDTLEALVEGSDILNYQLKSTFFRLEGVKIPSYMGRMVIKMNGNRTLSNYAKMLFEFGEFSGVGIKTSIGMGAIRINRRDKHE